MSHRAAAVTARLIRGAQRHTNPVRVKIERVLDTIQIEFNLYVMLRGHLGHGFKSNREGLRLTIHNRPLVSQTR